MVGSLPHGAPEAVGRPETTETPDREVRGLVSVVPRSVLRGPVRSVFAVGCDGGRDGQLLGLVHDAGRDLAELVTVLAGVVGAEEQLTAGLELDPEVGLSPATVTAVRSAQRRGARGNCSGHIGLISRTCSASVST